MRIVVERAALRRVVVWLRRALLAAAAALLGYCAFALIDAELFQRRENTNLDRLLWSLNLRAAGIPQTAVARVNAPVAAAGDLLGRIEIPRLALSVIVAEGVGEATLRRAVGHIPGTALPGAPGNVGLAGHRDTFFRPLKDLRLDDEIRLSTPQGIFEYKVESLKIVDPDNLSVLAASAGNVLTLVTCYPFFYVGPAPKRWIVKARQVVR